MTVWPLLNLYLNTILTLSATFKEDRYFISGMHDPSTNGAFSIDITLSRSMTQWPWPYLLISLYQFYKCCRGQSFTFFSIIKRTDRGASTFYFKNFCPRPRVIWFVPTITLESLNQSEPNFHTWLLSRQPRPRSKMGIAKLTYLWFQPIQTKFPYMTFDWNSSCEFKNGHHRSNVISLIGGFCPIEKCLWTR